MFIILSFVIIHLSFYLFAVGVPANVRLTLDIEVIDSQKEDLFKTIDSNKDKYLSLQEVKDWILYNPDVSG